MSRVTPELTPTRAGRMSATAPTCSMGSSAWISTAARCTGADVPGHGAQTGAQPSVLAIREQQVLGSNPSVGSTSQALSGSCWAFRGLAP